ncbi:hypothetical protein KKF91_08485 [Myxococcota bacterium]|nr:hypothetical protein [Myxococcota bacterium]MBU1430576.1 hypothetical protein [Myxococcota bacterium]
MKHTSPHALILAALALFGCDDDGGTTPVPFEQDSGGAAGGGAPPAGGEGGGQPQAGLPDRVDLDDEAIFPEGVAFDPQAGFFYIGSLAHGGLARVAPSGETTTFAAAPEGTWQTFGVKVDAQRRRLWACASQNNNTPNRPGFVWVFDLDSAEALARWPLSDAAPGGACNDVALDAAGDAYLTDPRAGRLYKATLEGVSLFLEDAALNPATPGLGFNGLAVTPDGAGLVVGSYIPAKLHYTPLSAPALTPIVLSGDELKGRSPMAGADGLIFLEDDLFIVFDGEVFHVTLSAPTAGVVAKRTHPDVTTGLSTATVAEGEVYVLKGEVMAFVTGQPPALPFSILKWPR